MAGVSADVEVTDHLLLVIGFEYLQKWTALNGAPWTMSDGTTYYTTLRSTYTEVPMYLRWRLGHSSVRWFCDLGASVSHMISTDAHILTAHGDVITRDLADDFRTTDLALVVGGGADIPFSSFSCIVVSVHYLHGLLDPFREENRESKFLGIQTDIGVMFLL